MNIADARPDPNLGIIDNKTEVRIIKATARMTYDVGTCGTVLKGIEENESSAGLFIDPVALLRYVYTCSSSAIVL